MTGENKCKDNEDVKKFKAISFGNVGGDVGYAPEQGQKISL